VPIVGFAAAAIMIAVTQIMKGRRTEEERQWESVMLPGAAQVVIGRPLT
jgi:hypothetical protein